MNLGGRLKQARKSRKLKQDQLVARVAGSSQQMLSLLERRDSKSTVLLFEFAEALNVNPRWLLTGEGESWLDRKPAPPDPALGKLIGAYGQINNERQRDLLNYANYLQVKP